MATLNTTLRVSELPGFLTSRPESEPTSLPFHVRTCGRICDQPMHSTRGTHHADGMLTVVISGRGGYHRKGRVLPVTGGMVGLVLPGDDPGILMADGAEPYDHYYCRFAGDLALATARRVAGSMSDAFVSQPDRVERLLPVMSQMSPTASRGPRCEHSPRTLRVVDTLLAQALSLLLSPPASGRTEITRESLTGHLRDRLALPFDLTAAAEHFDVSESHLCRAAKLELGRTLQQEAQRMKLEWAKVLLGQSGLSVAEVAARVGYRDPLYFSRVFSREVGVPASRWRREPQV